MSNESSLSDEVAKLKGLLANIAGGRSDLAPVAEKLKTDAPVESVKKPASTPTVVVPAKGDSQYTIEKLKAAFERKNFKWNTDTRNYQMNIVGIRNRDSATNIFNDTICWIYWLNGKQILETAKFTSEPGLYYLQNPINSKGCAILACGQYVDAYGLRLHRGLYEALCQNAPVRVYRDNDKDKVYDYGVNSETGEFGINIHRAAASGEVEKVDKYSAGCQVFKSVNRFDSFINACRKRRDLYGNKFTYTLLHDDWIE